MAHIGYGYGSEFHLLRLLGRHRMRLGRLILESSGIEDVRWLDFDIRGEYAPVPPAGADVKERMQYPKLPDKELLAVDFLSHSEIESRFLGAQSALNKWKDYWPTRGGTMNWDAVGYGKRGQQSVLLLVEAKAHIGEIKDVKNRSDTMSSASQKRIQAAFSATQEWLSVTLCDWLDSPYYQYANRLAVLHYLQQHDIAACFLPLYLCGDKNPRLRQNDLCPAKRSEWTAALAEMDKTLGIGAVDKACFGIHPMFVDVKSIVSC